MVKLTIDIRDSDMDFLKAIAQMSTKNISIEAYGEPAQVPKEKEDVAAELLSHAIRQAETRLKECGVYRRQV